MKKTFGIIVTAALVLGGPAFAAEKAAKKLDQKLQKAGKPEAKKQLKQDLNRAADFTRNLFGGGKKEPAKKKK